MDLHHFTSPYIYIIFIYHQPIEINKFKKIMFVNLITILDDLRSK